MSKRIAVFPGQGSQTVGMARALADASPAARAVLAEVDEALGEKLSAVMFEGPAETLTRTANAQPALMATSMAALRALEERLGHRLTGKIAAVAGHSLGEWTALCAAGALPLAETARLLRLRGTAMQEAVPEGQGAMAIVLGLDPETVEAVAAEASTEGGACELANDNDSGQAVISGDAAAVERGMALAKAKGAKRCLKLPVSAPFHCSLMQPARERMAAALAAASIAAPAVPVLANVTAELTADPDTIRRLLVEQVTGRVRWRESMAKMASRGFDTVLELGAGKVLTGLARRAIPGALLLNVAEPADLEVAAAALAA